MVVTKSQSSNARPLQSHQTMEELDFTYSTD